MNLPTGAAMRAMVCRRCRATIAVSSTGLFGATLLLIPIGSVALVRRRRVAPR